MKNPPSHRWLPLWLNLMLLVMALSLYAPFGLRGNFGLFEEFTARYGRLPESFATRLTALWSFQAADWLAPDSFVGFNWMMVALFWLKGALMVGIIRHLFPKQISIALVGGLLIMVYPADSGFMTLRILSIHFVMVCALGATYDVIRFWQKPHWAWWLAIAPLQVLALGYEINYPVFMLVPLIWLVHGISRRGVLLALMWGATPLLLGLRALWLIRSGEGGYVGSMVDRSNTYDPLTWAVARDSLQALFERHLTGWQHGLELLTDAPYGWLAIGVGVSSGLLILFYGEVQNWAGLSPAPTDEQALRRGQVQRASQKSILTPQPPLHYVARGSWRRRIEVPLHAMGRGFPAFSTPSQPDPAYKLKWRVYPILVGFGLAWMLAAYSLYLPTTFRMDTFRVNLITTMGAALAVSAFLAGIGQALGKIGRYWLAGWTAILVMGGMAYQLDQAEDFADLSANIERLLGGIAMEAPAVQSDSVIVYLDREYAFQTTMQLGGRSYFFEEAVQFIYDDSDLRGILCVVMLQPHRDSCTFTADGLIRVDHRGHEERLPYDRLIVLHTGYDGRVHLLTALPPDYTQPYGLTPPAYAPLNRVNLDAAPPDRVYTAFPCWPLEKCLEFPPTPEPIKAVRIEMDTAPPGIGWDGYAAPPGVRWTVSTHATLHLDLATTAPLQFQMKVGYVLLPDILNSLALTVNGVDIPLTQSQDSDGAFLYTGVIPAGVLAQNPYGLDETLLVIQTDRVVSPAELGIGADTRALGVLIDWVAVGLVS